MTQISDLERNRRARFRVFMDTYYVARHAEVLAMEQATAGYAAEIAEYIERWGRPLYFKQYLIMSRGCPR